MICFIRTGDGPVGMFSTINPRGLLRRMQTTSGTTLTLVGWMPGARGTIKNVRTRFAHLLNEHGWFAPDKDLLTWIALRNADTSDTAAARSNAARAEALEAHEAEKARLAARGHEAGKLTMTERGRLGGLASNVAKKKQRYPS